jgi:hypothetical protein
MNISPSFKLAFRKFCGFMLILMTLLSLGMVIRVAGRSTVRTHAPLVKTPNESGETTSSTTQKPAAELPDDIREIVTRTNQFFETSWAEQKLTPATPAEDLIILRRMQLALMGTIPSLEDIRRFQQDDHPQKFDRWCQDMLHDPRSARYLAERFARAYVGTDINPFIIFRRDRFLTWLTEQLQHNRPYDQIVRDMITSGGTWTGKPEVNFISSAILDGKTDYDKLTSRTVRAFLGQRIDCAQCHDHPFAHWKQSEYEGLAAFYGQAKISIAGIIESPKSNYKVQDRKTLETKEITPQVPYHPEWVPQIDHRRQQLAQWITHPGHLQFERAIINRLWAIMYGRPLSSGAIYGDLDVDDLPDPPVLAEGDKPDLLNILGEDFRLHNYDLQRTLRIIAAARPYQLSSEVHVSADEQADAVVSDEAQSHAESYWAVFPLVRLRPEQAIGAMLQANCITTVDQNDHVAIRFLKIIRENDFVKEYGDFGADEFVERKSTIPQALLSMNGKLVNELTNAGPFSSSWRIAQMTSNSNEAIRMCFWVCLSRSPTPHEQEVLISQVQELKNKQRLDWFEDLFWTLFNSPEFTWNH